MNRKATIDGLFAKRATPAGGASIASDTERVRTGAISAMGTSLKELTQSAQTATRLQEQLAAGLLVVELDPSTVEESMIADRLAAPVDPSFEALKESIQASGQQVPILVRPSPSTTGRYQIAYGRRRLRACAVLGVKVKAVIRQLSDDELVVAQGTENLQRRDLSFIERALFARRLEDRGFERSVIMTALAADKADLSRYIAVARLIPEPIALAIGPAGKAGRARWVAFAELLKQSKAERILASEIETPAFGHLASDERFAKLYALVAKPTAKHGTAVRAWKTARGQKAGSIEQRSDRTVVTIDEKAVPAFGQYLAAQLDALYERFLNEQTKEDKAS